MGLVKPLPRRMERSLTRQMMQAGVGDGAGRLRSVSIDVPAAGAALLTAPADRKYVIKSIMVTSRHSTEARLNITTAGRGYIMRAAWIPRFRTISYDAAHVLNPGDAINANWLEGGAAGVIVVTYMDVPLTSPASLFYYQNGIPSVVTWHDLYTSGADGNVLTHITFCNVGDTDLRIWSRCGGANILEDHPLPIGTFLWLTQPIRLLPTQTLGVYVVGATVLSVSASGYSLISGE